MQTVTIANAPQSIRAFWDAVNFIQKARGEKPYTEAQMTGVYNDLPSKDPADAALSRVAASFARQSASQRTGVALPSNSLASAAPLAANQI